MLRRQFVDADFICLSGLHNNAARDYVVRNMITTFNPEYVATGGGGTQFGHGHSGLVVFSKHVRLSKKMTHILTVEIRDPTPTNILLDMAGVGRISKADVLVDKGCLSVTYLLHGTHLLDLHVGDMVRINKDRPSMLPAAGRACIEQACAKHTSSKEDLPVMTVLACTTHADICEPHIKSMFKTIGLTDSIEKRAPAFGQTYPIDVMPCLQVKYDHLMHGGDGVVVEDSDLQVHSFAPYDAHALLVARYVVGE